MASFLEGSQAVADAVALCRPAVVPAYPITPQTHIVERLGRLIAAGTLQNSEFITVESEFAAMSAAIGASACGARTYTATASQGLLYMTEAMFNAAGLGLPIVMTVANRAIGAPINIWSDHSDSMSQRDCGWIQLYAQDNQHAIDLHVMAFRLAERTSLPVMVCMDGFVLTHAFEPVELPDQAAVDAFLPAFEPRQVLDPAAPVTIGAMVGPEAFTEVRYLSELQLVHARSDFTELAEEFAEHIGRPLEPVSGHRLDGAGTVIVCLGSVTGTLRMLSDELAGTEDGFGVLTVNMFRPFPYEEVREALAGAQRVIVLERAFAPGSCGIMSQDVRYALSRTPAGALYTVVAGLGGRSIRRESLRQLLIDARSGLLEDLSFLDLRTEVVTQELARSREQANPGPSTLSLLRASAAPASGMH